MNSNLKKKRGNEAATEEQTVWSCSDENCNGWMRPEFTFQEEPDCPLCGSAMELTSKLVPPFEG